MAIREEIELDLLKPMQYVHIRLQQNDLTDREVDALITAGGEVYDIPSNVRITLRMLKKDNTPIFNQCEIVDNKARFRITPQMSAVSGVERQSAQLQIMNIATGGILKTIKFHMLIDEEVINDNMIVSTGEFTELHDALLRVEDVDVAYTESLHTVNEAVINTNTATSNANTATNNANAATTAANTARNNAITATNNATTATSNANTATSNTTAAIASANTATDRANTASEAAESLLINRAGINDLTPTLSEAFSGRKVQTKFDDIDISFNSVESQLQQKAKQYSVDVMYPPIGFERPHADGVHDDSVALNKIIKYCVANKYNIYIPSGNYLASLEVVLPESATFDTGVLNIRLFGDGELTRIKSPNDKILFVSGNDNLVNGGSPNLRGLEIENIYLDGSDNNTIAIHLKKVQDLKLNNIFISRCKENAFLFDGAMDIKLMNIDILRCGRAISASDCAYALEFRNCTTGDYTQVSNAIHFTNVRIELCPCIIRSDGGTYGVYFENCKLEKGTVNILEVPNRPICFNKATEFGFTNCHLVNNHWTTDTTEMVEDAGLAFIYSMDNLINGQQVRGVNFTNCNFACAPNIYSMWYDGSNCKFINCTFGGTCGNVTSYANVSNGYPFTLGNNNSFINCVIAIRKGNRCMAFNGKNNKIDITINNHDNVWINGAFGFGTTAKNNTINYYIVSNTYDDDNYTRVFVNPTTINQSSVLSLGTNNIINSLTTKTASSDTYNKNFERFLGLGAITLNWVRYCYDGYLLTVIATASNAIIGNDGNLRTKDGNNKTLINGQTITFIFKDGVGYEQ